MISPVPVTPVEANQINILALAYLGDAVYELCVRNALVDSSKAKASVLHISAQKYVSAKAQKKSMELIMPELTEDEINVFKRGRNAKPPNMPKNAETADYRYATGFEALMGYLYITGQNERLNKLCAYISENM